MPIRFLPLFLIVLMNFSARSQGIQDDLFRFRKGIHRTADSLQADERSYVDTLFAHGDSSARAAAAGLRTHTDSLLSATGDSLEDSNRNSVRALSLDMERSLGVVGVDARTSVRLLLSVFEKELKKLTDIHSRCDSCISPESIASEYGAYRTEADSLSGFWGDSMATWVEGWETGIDEKVKAYSDSIEERIREFSDESAEKLVENASHLDVTGSYARHSSYRGRDNGVSEASFGPTLKYTQRSGLYGEGAIDWVSRGSSGPDDVSLSGGYEFTASSALSGSISYTHFWYSDSSTKPQSVTNQSIAGMLLLDVDVASLTLNLSDDFGGGGGSEFTTSLDLSRDQILSDRVWGGSLKIAPTVSATWGDQNEKLRQRRIIKAKKKAVVRVTGKPQDIFGIMGYELSLPADFVVGNLSVEPEIGYVIPVNVLNGKTVLVKDPSTSDPFVTAGLTVTLTLK